VISRRLSALLALAPVACSTWQYPARTVDLPPHELHANDAAFFASPSIMGGVCRGVTVSFEKSCRACGPVQVRRDGDLLVTSFMPDLPAPPAAPEFATPHADKRAPLASEVSELIVPLDDARGHVSLESRCTFALTGTARGVIIDPRGKSFDVDDACVSPAVHVDCQ